MTQSTRGNPPRTFSRFTAPKRERLSTGRGEGAVVQIGSKPYLVVSKLRSDDSSKWREDPTVAAVLKTVARYYGDYRPLTDYRLIKVRSTGRPGWYVYLCSRPQEQAQSRLVRSVRERYAAADDTGMAATAVIPASRLRHRTPAGNRGRGGLTRANAVRRGK